MTSYDVASNICSPSHLPRVKCYLSQTAPYDVTRNNYQTLPGLQLKR
jgi:hypothetical protein